jgi:cyclase
MVKVRLIPTLLLMNGRMIKTKQFDTFRDVGNPVTVAKVYDAQRADELVFLDITATVNERRFLLDTIRDVANECFMPLTAGGGIRTIEHARELLRSGADKVAVNSSAVENPSLISEIAKAFGRSTVLASIDYKRNAQGKNEVHTHRGQTPTGLDPVSWAKKVEELGAGEILLTSVDREGTMTGYDIDTIRAVSDAVTIPVIASGGVGTVQDLVDGITLGHASAVAAASIFHFTDQSIFKAHSHMHDRGLPVRR